LAQFAGPHWLDTWTQVLFWHCSPLLHSAHWTPPLPQAAPFEPGMQMPL
jgi:hypothetical protein